MSGLASPSATAPTCAKGGIEKVYPLIENGRVTVDVAVDGLPDTFIGQRILVRVPVGTRAGAGRSARRDPATARGSIWSRSRSTAARRTVTVVPGPVVDTPDGPMVEILTGLRSGDTVILP